MIPLVEPNEEEDVVSVRSNDQVMDVEERVDLWLERKGVIPALPTDKKEQYFDSLKHHIIRDVTSIRYHQSHCRIMKHCKQPKEGERCRIGSEMLQFSRESEELVLDTTTQSSLHGRRQEQMSKKDVTLTPNSKPSNKFSLSGDSNLSCIISRRSLLSRRNLQELQLPATNAKTLSLFDHLQSEESSSSPKNAKIAHLDMHSDNLSCEEQQNESESASPARPYQLYQLDKHVSLMNPPSNTDLENN